MIEWMTNHQCVSACDRVTCLASFINKFNQWKIICGLWELTLPIGLLIVFRWQRGELHKRLTTDTGVDSSLIMHEKIKITTKVYNVVLQICKQCNSRYVFGNKQTYFAFQLQFYMVRQIRFIIINSYLAIVSLFFRENNEILKPSSTIRDRTAGTSFLQHGGLPQSYTSESWWGK
jgi:hypothetical protein